MTVSFGTLRAVNPYSLATVSGVTKVPGFASSPIPPVIRPDLLTSQLMGCHPQCESCNGSHAGPAGQGFAGYIPPDYGTLRGLANGEYGLFKMWSGQASLPAGPGGGGIPGGTGTSAPTMAGLGKGAVGTNPASTYNTRNWSFGLRGLGKGAVGTNPASTYNTRNWSFGLRGLGQDQSTDQTSTQQTRDFANTLNKILSIFRPGASEADAIVGSQTSPGPQTTLGNNLNSITQQFLIGTNPSVATLQSLYSQVANMWANFKNFVASPQFTDRRASAQALNTIGPLIDGTCGYGGSAGRLPPGPVTIAPLTNCGHWGSGSIGGDGTNGMLGALQRAITNAGGIAPITSPFLTSGIPSTIGGIPTTTLLLILAGVFVISRMR